MPTLPTVVARWRYLRSLLQDQLARFEEGSLVVHTEGEDVTTASIIRLRREIEAFDELLEGETQHEGSRTRP